MASRTWSRVEDIPGRVTRKHRSARTFRRTVGSRHDAIADLDMDATLILDHDSIGESSRQGARPRLRSPFPSSRRLRQRREAADVGRSPIISRAPARPQDVELGCRLRSRATREARTASAPGSAAARTRSRARASSAPSCEVLRDEIGDIRQSAMGMTRPDRSDGLAQALSALRAAAVAGLSTSAIDGRPASARASPLSSASQRASGDRVPRAAR